MSRRLTKNNEDTLPVNRMRGGRDKGGDGVFSNNLMLTGPGLLRYKGAGIQCTRGKGP